MCLKLPATAIEFRQWTWPQIEPHFDSLAARPLFADELTAWLADWTHLSLLLQETYWRFFVATTVNTSDAEAQARFHTFLDEIHPKAQAAEQKLSKLETQIIMPETVQAVASMAAV